MFGREGDGRTEAGHVVPERPRGRRDQRERRKEMEDQLFRNSDDKHLLLLLRSLLSVARLSPVSLLCLLIHLLLRPRDSPLAFSSSFLPRRLLTSLTATQFGCLNHLFFSLSLLASRQLRYASVCVCWRFLVCQGSD